MIKSHYNVFAYKYKDYFKLTLHFRSFITNLYAKMLIKNEAVVSQLFTIGTALF